LIVDGEPLNFEEVRYSGGIKTLKNPVNVSWTCEEWMCKGGICCDCMRII
jgi:hypothetical protein